MAIRRRTERTDPSVAEAIERFGSQAEPAPVTPAVEPPAPVATVTSTEAAVASRAGAGVARPLSSRRKPTHEELLSAYAEIADRHAHLGGVEFEALPRTLLIRHDDTREAAMLIALLADVEDRSQHKIAQTALLEGLRAWSARLQE